MCRKLHPTRSSHTPAVLEGGGQRRAINTSGAQIPAGNILRNCHMHVRDTRSGQPGNDAHTHFPKTPPPLIGGDELPKTGCSSHSDSVGWVALIIAK